MFDVFESDYTMKGEERAAHWDEGRVTRPYREPVLPSDREAYVNMIVDFYRSHMISFTWEPREKGIRLLRPQEVWQIEKVQALGQTMFVSQCDGKFLQLGHSRQARSSLRAGSSTVFASPRANGKFRCW